MSAYTMVTGLGMVSCVGFDVATSAASVRAGISRFGPVDGQFVFDEDELEAPLLGAPIPLITKGFIQQGRLLRLLEHALSDLLDHSGLEVNNSAFWEDVLVVWVLPNISERFNWPEDEVVSWLQQYLSAVLAARFGIKLSTPPNGYFLEGQSGGARSLRAIARTFNAGHYKRALCISVDSLLEPLCIEQLQEDERLKTPENPVGIIPGELAAIALLETPEACQERNGIMMSRILNSVHVTHEQQVSEEDADNDSSDVDETDEDQSNSPHVLAKELGVKLGKAVIEALSVLGEQPYWGDIYLDINGEEWRAIVWGIAQVTLKGSKRVALEHCNEIVPATSWGDVGAASGIAAVALATRSFERGYAKSNLALICSVSDNGNIGVTLVTSN
ncbi:hypothetical protein [Teredinibacter sp. KSP-S5-2]|uniref:hypothetical protein n=1 Tax=Teredinibacter sp. KSP-S5-2 TaxID=3034506 RepID=UPI002934ECA2|nr:hypothetical protein [Teredinibacter sp. KSP-S5-2]WNO10390.1 hypothetical protein P5V12_04325 [Teredinibacter sp. KSP-S5-2]